MTKLSQTMVLLLMALMMSTAAATALAQGVPGASQAGPLPYTGSGFPVWGNLQFNSRVGSDYVMAPHPGPAITLDKSGVRVETNHQVTLEASFLLASSASELKVMSDDNTIATARVVGGNKIQILGLKEGTTIITVESVLDEVSSARCTVTVYTQNGDVNCDGSLSINDVTGLIAYLLGSEGGTFKVDNADTNGDGNITISDVTKLIDYLLGGSELYSPEILLIDDFKGDTIKMVAVQGGTFTMGATVEQGSDASDDEKPTRQVTLSSYYIGETEVTQALWEHVMRSNPSEFYPGHGYSENRQRPVENITWSACLEFIDKLNRQTGYNFRLPTEAEWEFAARGGNKSRGYKYSGSNTANDVAWLMNNIPSQVSGTEGYGTQSVATKAPNELGLYDMSGNVWEWCQDLYFPYDPQTAPIDLSHLDNYVARGGSWSDEPTDCRVSRRGHFGQLGAFNTVGLRLVLDMNDNPNFGLSESAVTVPVGESKSVDILNGHGTYTVAGGGNNANGVIDGQRLIVNGNAAGTTALYVTDNASGAISLLRVFVADKGQTFTANGVSFTMMAVEGGTFTMGSLNLPDVPANYYEIPAHQVTLSGYSIGQTEVTQELWQAVMGYNPSFYSSAYCYNDDLNRPIENVSWDECQEFIAKLNELTGRKFRLPTEAEWEYAARGGNRSLCYKYAGSNNLNEVAWHDYNAHNSTHPVATKIPNELGLYDMTGNVFERCLDWFCEYTADDQINPVGPLTGEYDVIRGGSWWVGYVTLTERQYSSGFETLKKNYQVGLRLALDEENSSKFRLSETAVISKLGESKSINILNGHGDYTVTFSTGGDHVDVDVNNDCLTVHAKTVGSSKIYVTDNATGATTILCFIVNADDQVFSANGVPFRMVNVEGGTFTMGATPEQGFDVVSNERPTHQVTLSGYSISQTEVTQELWIAVMGTNPSHNVPYYSFETNSYAPVECVSWYDCQAFIAKLNELTGRTFRLPTEAEWEYAARGGNKSQGYMYSGSDKIDSVAWYSENCNSTKNVATKAHNELGLFDMSGNVWEWCQDWYGSYSSDEQTNPSGPTTGTSRVIRGGSWGNYGDYCRLSFRSRNKPANSYNYLGFRLVLDEEDSPKFSLTESVVKVAVGESKTITVVNGHGDYTVTGGEENVDTYINGDNLTVTGKAKGSTTLYLTDNVTGMTAVLNIIVTEFRTFTVNDVTFTMVAVEGGTFAMGTVVEQQDSNPYGEETPVHEVTLSGYSIGRTEVTQELWMAVMGNNPSAFTEDFEFQSHLKRPVEFVSWNDCQEFITRLNQMTGMTFRLPTEAEWEYAARGGNMSQGYLYSGSNSLNEVAWFANNSTMYCEQGSYYGTHEVATLNPNELGIYDMSGNVAELCQDWYGLYSSDAQTNPTGPSTGSHRVMRGGGYQYDPYFCRVSFRGEMSPTDMHRTVGLRLAL